METSFKRIVEKYRASFPAIFETCLIIAGLLAMLELLPRRVFSDGDVRFFAIIDLLHGKMSHMSYSLVGPVFSIPLFIIDKLSPVLWWWPSKYNIFLLGSSFLVAYIVFRNSIDRGLLRKFFLILLVASMFGSHVTFFGGETFTTLFVGFGTLAIALGPTLIGWVAIVLGVVNTPATLVGLGLLTLKHMFDNRRLRYALAVVAAGLLIITESWLRRGSPFNNGYGDQAFSTPFFIGLLSILFSFGKGLIFFMPGLLLPVKQSIFSLEQTTKARLYTAYILWLCFLLGMILVYSPWWVWSGGWFWGPRFFLFGCIPASFALALRLRKPSSSLFANLCTLLVLGLSLWVGINGAIYDLGDLAATCVVNKFARSYLCDYHPRYSVLWHPFFEQTQLSRSDKLFIIYSLCVFIYLATPLVLLMLRQTIAAAKVLSHNELNFRVWRF